MRNVRVALSVYSRKGNKVVEKKGVELVVVRGGCATGDVRIILVACPDKLGLFARRHMG